MNNTICLLSNFFTKLQSISVIIFLFLPSMLYSQCLSLGSIGDFESNDLSSEWWVGTQGNGLISIDSNNYFSGFKSVKIEVNSPSTWQVRMYNLSCVFNISTGNSYRVTIYAKGPIGNSIDISLLDNAKTESTQNIVLTSSNWREYQVILTSGVTSSNGKIRLNFREVGTYHVDNIYFEQVSMSPVSILEPNICWEGVLESEITSGGELRNFRFLKSYATNNLPGYYTAERAASSAGIIMKIKTASPTLNLNFSEDLNWAGDVFNHKISVFKDNIYEFSTNDFNISLSNNGLDAVEWKLVMPTYTQMNFKSIDIENGYAIESINCNHKPIYVAIGNSITMGVGLVANESRYSYSRLIADSLGYELYNWGIGGSKVNDTVFTNLRNSALKPDLITVLWGYNDVHFSSNDNHFNTSTFPKYENLLAAVLQNYPNACVMAILPTYTSNPINTSQRTVANLEAGQLNILNALQLTYPNLDFMKGTHYTSSISLADDVHLNNEGNKSLANGVISELNCGTITNELNVVSEKKIMLYPNPTSGIINLGKSQQYSVLDLSGKLLIKSFGQKIDLTKIEKGIYLVKLNTGTYKVVKE